MTGRMSFSFILAASAASILCAACGKSAETTETAEAGSKAGYFEAIPDDSASGESEQQGSTGDADGLSDTAGTEETAEDASSAEEDEPVPVVDAAEWAQAYRLEVNQNAGLQNYSCGLIYVNDDEVPELYESWLPSDSSDYTAQVSSYQGGTELLTAHHFISYRERENKIICGSPVDLAVESFPSSTQADYELMSLQRNEWRSDADGEIATSFGSAQEIPSQTFLLNGESSTEQDFLNAIPVQEAYSVMTGWDAAAAMQILDSYIDGSTDSNYAHVYWTALMDRTIRTESGEDSFGYNQCAFLDLDNDGSRELLEADQDQMDYALETCFRNTIVRLTTFSMADAGSGCGFDPDTHDIYFSGSMGGFNYQARACIRNGILIQDRYQAVQLTTYEDGIMYFNDRGIVDPSYDEEMPALIRSVPDYQAFYDVPLTSSYYFINSMRDADPLYQKLSAEQYDFLEGTANYLGNVLIDAGRDLSEEHPECDPATAYRFLTSSADTLTWYIFEISFETDYPKDDTGSTEPDTMKTIYQVRTDLLLQQFQDLWGQAPDLSVLPAADSGGMIWYDNGQIYGMNSDGSTEYALLTDIAEENGQLVVTYQTIDEGSGGNSGYGVREIVFYLTSASNPDGYTISLIQLRQ